MLPSILLDPSAVWMIHYGDTQEECETSVRQALRWMKPGSAGPYPLLLSMKGVEDLTTFGAFPAEPRLRDVLNSVGLSDVINPRSLATSVSRFLANSNWIEEQVGIADVLHDQTVVTPDLTSCISDDELRQISKNSVALVNLVSNCTPYLAIYAFPRLSEAGVDLQVDSTFDIVELRVNDALVEQEWSCRVRALSDPAAWHEGASPQELWCRAENASELELAIWITARGLAVQAGCDLREFRVGSSFLNDLREHNAAGNGVFAQAVLNKCAQTILSKSNLEPKLFCKGTAANAPIIKRARDGAAAWRLHVTKSHQALRLMYWIAPDGLIEFASLKVKFDHEIDEGEELPARTWNCDP